MAQRLVRDRRRGPAPGQEAPAPTSVYSALLAGSEKGVTLDDNLAAFGELGLRPARGRPVRRAGPGHHGHGPADLDAGADLAHRRAGRPPRRRGRRRPGRRRPGHRHGAVSSFASKPIEEVVAANPQTFFQIYWCGTQDADGGPARAGQGRRRRRAHRHPRLVVLPRPRLGQPVHPRARSTSRPMVALRPRGRPPAPLADRAGRRAGGLPDLTVPNMAPPGEPAPDVLRRLRRVDADAAAVSWDDLPGCASSGTGRS